MRLPKPLAISITLMQITQMMIGFVVTLYAYLNAHNDCPGVQERTALIGLIIYGTSELPTFFRSLLRPFHKPTELLAPSKVPTSASSSTSSSRFTLVVANSRGWPRGTRRSMRMRTRSEQRKAINFQAFSVDLCRNKVLSDFVFRLSGRCLFAPVLFTNVTGVETTS